MINKNYSKLLAKCYGFPDCCVDFYINKEKSTVPIHDKFEDSGYIPCEACRSKTYEDLVAEIDSKRLTPNDFPYNMYEITIYTILDSPKYSIKEKYFIIYQFLYNIRIRSGNTSDVENKAIKQVFKLIDKILMS